MRQAMTSKRPDCGIIIKTQNLWALNVNDFKIEDFLNIALSVDADSKKFQNYDILVSKLIDFKCRGGKRGVFNYEKCLKILMDYLTRNKYKPMIVQILSKALLDYATEYRMCELIDEIDFEQRKEKSQTKIKNKKFQKQKLKIKLNIELLEKVFEATMRSMESLPNNLQIQKNAISLCQELIHTDAEYDSNKCIQLVINSLFTFKNEDINHLSVKLFSSLVYKLSKSETKQLLSNPVNVEKLLELVENSINESNRDTILIERILSVFVKIKLNIELLEKVFEVTMRPMESFPNNLQIRINTISLLEQLIYTDAEYDSNKYKQLMINLLLKFKTEYFDHSLVKLFSILVNMLPESETKQLFSNPVNVEKLLKFAENSINESNRDTNLIEKILNVFVTIAYLSPNVCEIFVEKGGIDMCLHTLNVSLT
jgi:hypothetical protein